MSTTISIRPNRDGSTWVNVQNAIDISCNWEVNRAGIFTCRVPVSQMRAAGLGTTQVGALLQYTHAAAGAWDGRIMSYGGRDGFIEITAQSLNILARKRLTRVSSITKKPPGLLLQDAINDGNKAYKAPYNLNYTNSSIDVKTRNIKIRAPYGLDMYDELIPMITDELGMEWRVADTAQNNRVVSYATRIGVDRTQKLVEGNHIVACSWTDDLDGVTNFLRGVGVKKVTTTKAADVTSSSRTRNKPDAAGKKPPKPPKTTTTDYKEFEREVQVSRSVDKWGLLAELRNYPDINTEADLDEALAQELAVTADLLTTMEFEVVNVDQCWTWFREGDTINVALGISGWPGGAADSAQVRIMVRALDVTRGVMTVSAISSNAR